MRKHQGRRSGALAGLLCLVLVQTARGQEGAAASVPVKCVVCHTEELQPFKKSVHRAHEVLCTSCHGGDGESLEEESAHGKGDQGFLGKPPRDKIPELCGGCHSDPKLMRQYGMPIDQLALYRTSDHGRRLQIDKNARVAVCTDCHGHHDIRPADDPESLVFALRIPETCGRCHDDQALMSEYGISTTVCADYSRGLHGTSLLVQKGTGAPTCADCHGIHGATPPGVSEVGNVCGKCHVRAREYFKLGPHFQAAQQGRMEECTSCHDNHATKIPDVAMLAGDAPGHCGHCHEPADEGRRLAAEIEEKLKRIDELRRQAQARLREARERGMYVAEEQNALAQGERLLTQTIPRFHSVERELIAEPLRRVEAMMKEPGLAMEARFRKHRDRRIYGVVASLVVLLLAAVFYARYRLSLRKGVS